MKLLGLTGAWLSGIAVAHLAPFAGWQWLALGLVAASFTIINRSHRRTGFMLACFAALAFAGAWTHARRELLPPEHVRRLNDIGVKLTLQAWVKEPSQFRDNYTGLLVEIRQIETATGEPLRAVGEVLVFAPTGLTVQYGDLVSLHGTLDTPPVFESFDYREYLARQGVHSVLSVDAVTVLDSGVGPFPMNYIFYFRRSARATIFRLFPQPESSLLAGILIGDEYSIPEALRQDFNRTGTTHIIAISGFNITIIAAVLLGMFQRPLGARWGTVAAMTGITIYTLLVGADAAVVRAALMAGLSFLALRIGRQNDAISTLAASAFLMTLIEPLTLWDVGFQLSFAATLGLILYGQPMQEKLILAIQKRWALSTEAASRWGGPVGEFVLFTLAAQATTLPLSALYFGRLPLTAGLANPIILPLQPGVMVLAGIATLLGMIWLPLGELVAWAAWGFAAATIRVVEIFADLPLAAVEVTSLSPLAPAFFYIVLFGLTLPSWRGSRPAALLVKLGQAPLPNVSLLAAMALGVVMSWGTAISRPDGLLRVTALEVGGGQAILVQSPTGRNLLINGGASPVALEAGLGRRLPPFSRELDWVVVASPDQEATSGLRNLPVRFPVGAALVQPNAGGRDFEAFLEGMTYAGRPVLQIEPGMSLVLGGGAHLQVMSVDERAAALLITFGQARFLLPFGANPAPDPTAVAAGWTALFASGGGSDPATEVWLERAWPMIVVLSRAAEEAALPLSDALLRYPGRLLRTDREGWIELQTHGVRLWAMTERVP